MNRYELLINEVIAMYVLAGEVDEGNLRDAVIDEALGGDSTLERQLDDYIGNAIDLALRFKEAL